MQNKLTTSDSLIGSLCREIEYIESRSDIIHNSIINTKNTALTKRLKNELYSLKDRIESIKRLSRLLTYEGKVDSISIEFLNELISRSLVHNFAN